MVLTTREATYVHGDQEMIDYTPGAAVSDGDVVVQTDMVGVALKDIAASALGAICVRGVFDFTKNTGSGTAIAAGDTLYWDNTDNYVSTSSGDGNEIGKAVAAAATTAALVRVILNQ